MTRYTSWSGHSPDLKTRQPLKMMVYQDGLSEWLSWYVLAVSFAWNSVQDDGALVQTQPGLHPAAPLLGTAAGPWGQTALVEPSPENQEFVYLSVCILGVFLHCKIVQSMFIPKHPSCYPQANWRLKYAHSPKRQGPFPCSPTPLGSKGVGIYQHYQGVFLVFSGLLSLLSLI